MRKKRNHYTPEEKLVILRRHLVEGEAVSALCDEYRLPARVYFCWQQRLFENAAAASPSAFPVTAGRTGRARKTKG